MTLSSDPSNAGGFMAPSATGVELEFQTSDPGVGQPSQGPEPDESERPDTFVTTRGELRPSEAAKERIERMGGAEKYEEYARGVREYLEKIGLSDQAKNVPPTAHDYIEQFKDSGMVESYNEAIKAFQRDLETKPRELRDAYRRGGIEAYNRAVTVSNERQAEAVKAFERDLEKAPAELRQAYRDGGVSAYNRAVEEYNRRQGKIPNNAGQDERRKAQEDERRKAQEDERRKAQEDSLAALARAGFVMVEYPSGGAPFDLYEAGGKALTIPNLAAFVRAHNDGLEVLTAAGFDDKVVRDVRLYNEVTGDLVAYLDNGVKVSGGSLGLSVGELSAMGRAMQAMGLEPTSGSWVVTYRRLPDDEKREVARLFDKDWTKGNAFSALAADIDTMSQANLAGQIALAGVQPITHPIGKQLVLEDARRVMASEYGGLLSAIGASYRRDDGTINREQLVADLNTDKAFANQVREQTGYDPSAVGKVVQFYNDTVRDVTRLEWTQAALVGAANFLLLGGSALLPTKGIAAVVARAFEYSLGPSMGAAYLKDTVRVVSAPDSTLLEKGVAVGGEVAAFAPAVVGPAIRSVQFAKVALRPDYVPLRSLSIEAATRRLPFSEAAMSRARSAGATDADFLRALREIETGLAEGKKAVTVEIGGERFQIENVAYQKMVGRPGGTLSFFSATPDITQLDRGGSVPLFKDFYLEAKAAVEPLSRSYSGERGFHPGIAQVLIPDDPRILADVAGERPFFRTPKGFEAEPELVIKGASTTVYRLEPIPGAAGRGMTFDATVGPVSIRRFVLAQVEGNPTGVSTHMPGGRAQTGTVAIGDLHGTTNWVGVFHDINTGYDRPVLSGKATDPATWHWVGEQQTLVFLGDMIDRGPAYETWRSSIGRLQNEAKQTGGRVERLLGNHELAYLTGDAIKGVQYTDATRSRIRGDLINDIRQGRVRAAVASDGKLYTHAGVSLGAFPEFRGKSATVVADRLNAELTKAATTGHYSGPIFSKGRAERGAGHSFKTPQQEQGGPFWLRPQEATPAQLDLGYPQVVGHNPGRGVRRIWGDNFIEVDVGRRVGGVGAFYSTPSRETVAVPITTRALASDVPQLSRGQRTRLAAQAMRDTVADVVLGWDGRIQAVEQLKQSAEAVAAMRKDLDRQIIARRAAGDSVGVRYLQKQKRELSAPTGRDYLYGGIGFWRDLVMGRQNSVKALGTAKGPVGRMSHLVGPINAVRSRIGELSDYDVRRLFGASRARLMADLDTHGLRERDMTRAAERLIAIVDAAVQRNLEPYLDRVTLARAYASRSRYDARGSRYDARGDTGGRGVNLSRSPQEGRAPLRSTDIPRQPAPPVVIPPPRVPPSEPPGRPPTGGGPPRIPGRPGKRDDTQRREDYRGALAWKQGVVVWAIKDPYQQADIAAFSVHDPPPGLRIVDGPRSAYESIVQLTGKAPNLALDMGIMDVKVAQPGQVPGRRGAIAFERDPGQRTRSPLRLSTRRVGF